RRRSTSSDCCGKPSVRIGQQTLESRSFWKAGDLTSVPQNSLPPKVAAGQLEHARVHPKFLHSNATSHKWAFGAIAELLDNAVDEIQLTLFLFLSACLCSQICNGATFVKVDRIYNVKDNSPALLFQDDGGGMDTEGIRKCMSLGYSSKKANTTIGQYQLAGLSGKKVSLVTNITVLRPDLSAMALEQSGYFFLDGNGFKTSTMRLGADVIVFSRASNRGYYGTSLTEEGGSSVEYFFGMPLLDLSFVVLSRVTQSVGLLSYTFLRRTGQDDVIVPMVSSLFLVDFDISNHWAEPIIYGSQDDWSTNLETILEWSPFASKDELMLQFEDIGAHGTKVIIFNLWLNDEGIFELNFDGDEEVPVETTIGFIKEAPALELTGLTCTIKTALSGYDMHFTLFQPFWKVTSDGSSQGNGVVGVLEANFMEPAHDKQDFERSSLFIRLEMRLKQMVAEYWRGHCHLVGHRPYNPNPSRIHVQSPVGHMANVQKQLPIGDHVIGLPGNVQNKTRRDHPIIGLPAELGQELTGTQPGDHCRTVFSTECLLLSSLIFQLGMKKVGHSHKEPAQEVGSVDSITSTSIDRICEENIHLFMRCEEHVQKENELRKTIEALENQVEETKRKCAQLSAHLESRKKRKVMQQIEEV
ncbi:hypothetical protein C3L33_17757, partial [Rhododendron williamsianum]